MPTMYEQQMERLKRLRWDSHFPVELRNCFVDAGITKKEQLVEFRDLGGDFKRFHGIGKTYEKLIIDWLEEES